MEIVCKCGYEGNQMVEFTTEIPMRKLVEWKYSNYYDHVNWLNHGGKTLNWACPKCGKVLVQQRGGLSYNQSELKDMIRRLWNKTFENKKYLREKQHETI